MHSNTMKTSLTTRRSFLQTISLGAAALGINAPAYAAEKVIPGFEKTAADASTY